MRKVLLTSLVVALAAALAATAAEGRAHGRAAVSGNVLLAGWASSGAEFDSLNKVIGDFQKKYPAIHVTYQPINNNYPQTMLARFASHTPPDVFYVDSSVAPDWIKQGVMEPLNPFFA